MNDDSINFHEFVNQIDGQRVFFKNYEIPAPRKPYTFRAVEIKDPRTALLDNDKPEEKRRPRGHTISGHDMKLWPLL